jgi:hypothetical protein
MDVRLAALDREGLLAEDELRWRPRGIERIGVVRELSQAVVVSGGSASHGRWRELASGGRLWTVTIESPAAEAIRLHLEQLMLPAGTEIIVYDIRDPQEAYGPYDVGYLHGQSHLWTESVFASAIALECYVPEGTSVKDVAFHVHEIAHMYVNPLDLLQPEEFACHNDVACYPAWADLATAIAGIGTIGSVGVVWCSGALMNDLDGETVEEYFMTANHCLSGSTTVLGTQAQANTLEFYWLYQTASCPPSPTPMPPPPNPATVPRTGGGADLLSIQTMLNGSEHAFLRIRNAVPGGLALVGWTTGSPGGSDTLTGIHHPDGTHKRISFGSLDENSDVNFWEVEWTDGTTEPGSSGSPLLNPSGLLIGQLRGGPAVCPPNGCCDYYGRFNVTYGSIRPWLEMGGTINVNGAYSGTEEGTPSRPFNTVGEANAIAWDGVRFKVHAGSYPETLTINRKVSFVTVGGTVTIGDMSP